MELESLSRITAEHSRAQQSTARRPKQSCGKPTGDAQFPIAAAAEARYLIAIATLCLAFRTTAAIIGGEAIKLRGGPSFNFDETSETRWGLPPNGGPLVKTHECTAVLSRSGILVGWRA